jgi:hypothetical protein
MAIDFGPNFMGISYTVHLSCKYRHAVPQSIQKNRPRGGLQNIALSENLPVRDEKPAR